MPLSTPVDFNAYGFTLQASDQQQFVSYGEENAVWLDLNDLVRVPKSVLFSIYRINSKAMEMTVGPSLLDLPFEPPFLYIVNDPAEAHAIMDDHRRRADRLTFDHGSIAEYLALRHVNRLFGEVLGERDVAFITRLELDYDQKLRMLLLNG